MSNRESIHRTLRRWHMFGGLIVAPFAILLGVTGAIYLFYPDTLMDIGIIEKQKSHKRISLEEQLKSAKSSWPKPIEGVRLDYEPGRATEFVSGRFSGKASLYINPYNGSRVSNFAVNESKMFKVRKLHGELLLGAFGTKIIELVACWMVVLIISGLYIYWPRKDTGGIVNLFRIRTRKGKELFMRDTHAFFGFWCSILLLLILAGGLPWTDVFGGFYKKVQKELNAGYPKTWFAHAHQSGEGDDRLTLDQMAAIATKQNLAGNVFLHLPKNDKSVFSVSNETSQLSKLKMMHYDQYSGKLIHEDSWQDIGVMMKSRLWVMAFHQGQFGRWNWLLVFFVALALVFLSTAAIISYLPSRRRRIALNQSYNIIDDSFQFPLIMKLIVVVLGIFLLLFGLSIVLIILLRSLMARKYLSI